mmetsp:Transcript_3720/g.11971  ORF Transcript_3720/g.11971 Transcript_3720/m.11971 type:complete len:98 (+) Transcript_3720:195-488(+)
MSIITPSRLWRGVWRAGSAAAAYSPSSRGEIAIWAISGDLEREVGSGRRLSAPKRLAIGRGVWLQSPHGDLGRRECQTARAGTMREPAAQAAWRRAV